MKHISAILALLILLTVGLACSDSDGKTTTNNTGSTTESSSGSGTAAIESVTLKNADDETVTSFKPSDAAHKIEVRFSETSPGKVRGVFTAVNAGGEKNFKILEKEIELGTLMNTATFTAKLDKGFPAGDYKFDIYVNDKLTKTQNYKVQ